MQDQESSESEEEYALKRWEEYNEAFYDSSTQAEVITDNLVQRYDSFTHYFFTEYQLEQYLNKDSRNILQLGASLGRFCDRYAKAEWNIIAYDWSEAAVNYLNKNKIHVKKINLNKLTDDNKALAYEKELMSDIDKPINIFIFKIIEYLTDDAANLLIYTLINASQKGSVFMFGGSIYNKPTNRSTVRGNIASLFYARSDIEILKHGFSRTYQHDDEGNEVCFCACAKVFAPHQEHE